MTQQFHTQVDTQENWKCMFTQKLVHDVNISIIHNRQKVETTKMSISEWMDKQIVEYPHDGIFSAKKKKLSTDTYHNTNEPWKHHAKWKSVIKDHLGCDSICMKQLEWANL